MLLVAQTAPAPAPAGFRPPSPPYSPPQRGARGALGSSGHAWSLKPMVETASIRLHLARRSIEKLAHRLDKLPKYEVQLDAAGPPSNVAAVLAATRRDLALAGCLRVRGGGETPHGLLLSASPTDHGLSHIPCSLGDPDFPLRYLVLTGAQRWRCTPTGLARAPGREGPSDGHDPGARRAAPPGGSS